MYVFLTNKSIVPAACLTGMNATSLCLPNHSSTFRITEYSCLWNKHCLLNVNTIVADEILDGRNSNDFVLLQTGLRGFWKCIRCVMEQPGTKSISVLHFQLFSFQVHLSKNLKTEPKLLTEKKSLFHRRAEMSRMITVDFDYSCMLHGHHIKPNLRSNFDF